MLVTKPEDKGIGVGRKDRAVDVLSEAAIPMARAMVAEWEKDIVPQEEEIAKLRAQAARIMEEEGIITGTETEKAIQLIRLGYGVIHPDHGAAFVGKVPLVSSKVVQAALDQYFGVGKKG